MNKYTQTLETDKAANCGYAVLGTVDFDSRIEEKPFYTSWQTSEFSDYILEEGKINYDGLNDCQKLCLYVYAWNQSNLLPGKKRLLKRFGWTNYYLQKLIKSLNGKIITEPAFNENTGMLSGRGYFYCA